MKTLPSEELLSAVLGKEVTKVRDLEDSNLYFQCIDKTKHYYTSGINIHELAHMVKEWAKSNGYYLQSGFNTDIIADDGSIDFDYKTVDKYETIVHKLVYDKKPRMKQIAYFGDDFNSDFKAGEWILKEINNV